MAPVSQDQIQFFTGLMVWNISLLTLTIRSWILVFKYPASVWDRLWPHQSRGGRRLWVPAPVFEERPAVLQDGGRSQGLRQSQAGTGKLGSTARSSVLRSRSASGEPPRSFVPEAPVVQVRPVLVLQLW